jgi:hypothetical protein
MEKNKEKDLENIIELQVAIETLKFRANYLKDRVKVIEEDGKEVEDTVLKYSGMAGRYAAITRGLGEEILATCKKLDKIAKYYGN